MAMGGAFTVAVLPIVAPKLQPASYVFGTFDTSQRDSLGMPSDA